MPAPDSSSVLALSGDIDLYQSPAVKAKLDGLIGQQTRQILVDLSAVQYMDSSGLALFIEALQRIGAYGGQLALFGLQDSVKHIFEVSRLDQVFRIFPDEAAARAAL